VTFRPDFFPPLGSTGDLLIQERRSTPFLFPLKEVSLAPAVLCLSSFPFPPFRRRALYFPWIVPGSLSTTSRMCARSQFFFPEDRRSPRLAPISNLAHPTMARPDPPRHARLTSELIVFTPFSPFSLHTAEVPPPPPLEELQR